MAQGKSLFANNCSTCHGINGEGQTDEGGGIFGPPLVGVGAASCDFQVGTGRMPLGKAGTQAEKHPVVFSPSEIAALCAFIDSLGPAPAVPDAAQYNATDLTTAEIARGGELFRSNCSQCHGASANGGALAQGAYAPSIQVSGRYIYEAMLIGPQQMPLFSDSTLAPQDKKEIIGYLNTLRSQPDAGGLGLGRLGTVPEGMIAWIVGIGLLIAVAVWLGIKGVRV